jgi:hypothetical protein
VSEAFTHESSMDLSSAQRNKENAFSGSRTSSAGVVSAIPDRKVNSTDSQRDKCLCSQHEHIIEFRNSMRHAGVQLEVPNDGPWEGSFR